MTSSRWSKVFPCLLVAGLAWAPACGGDDDDDPAAGAGSSTGGSGTGGSGTGGSGTGGSGMDPAPAINCANRCSAITASCGLSPDVCQNVCSRATENQLICAEMAGCSVEALNRCFATGSGTGGSGTGGSGTGGSGTGGSGTGGSGGGGLPDTVTVTGRRDPADEVTTTSSDDMTKIFTGIEGVANAAYSVTVNVKLQDATSVEVTSPSSNCADIDAMQWVLNPSQMSFVFIGQDVLPATDCADFADDVVAGGVTARFTDVPVLNSSEKIKTLILEFKP